MIGSSQYALAEDWHLRQIWENFVSISQSAWAHRWLRYTWAEFVYSFGILEVAQIIVLLLVGACVIKGIASFVRRQPAEDRGRWRSAALRLGAVGFALGGLGSLRALIKGFEMTYEADTFDFTMFFCHLMPLALFPLYFGTFIMLVACIFNLRLDAKRK
jgi:amino acid transporter